MSAGVVPLGATPPAQDDPRLPHCLWTVEEAVLGRVHLPELVMPCMGVALDDPGLAFHDGALDVEAPSLEVVGAVNERAYDDEGGGLGALVGALRDPRVRTHGLRRGGAFACVALTMTVGGDLSVQYVATEAAHRRRGLAAGLLLAVLGDARAEGLRTATLQASADGFGVYERLGFRTLATLRGFLGPAG